MSPFPIVFHIAAWPGLAIHMLNIIFCICLVAMEKRWGPCYMFIFIKSAFMKALLRNNGKSLLKCRGPFISFSSLASFSTLGWRQTGYSFPKGVFVPLWLILNSLESVCLTQGLRLLCSCWGWSFSSGFELQPVFLHNTKDSGICMYMHLSLSVSEPWFRYLLP